MNGDTGLCIDAEPFDEDCGLVALSAVVANCGDGRSDSALRPIIASIEKSVEGLICEGIVGWPMDSDLRGSCIMVRLLLLRTELDSSKFVGMSIYSAFYKFHTSTTYEFDYDLW
jgi:hypothetical protein